METIWGMGRRSAGLKANVDRTERLGPGPWGLYAAMRGMGWAGGRETEGRKKAQLRGWGSDWVAEVGKGPSGGRLGPCRRGENRLGRRPSGADVGRMGAGSLDRAVTCPGCLSSSAALLRVGGGGAGSG